MIRVLHDIKLRPRYAATGDYARFIPILSVKPGVKGAIEKRFLQLQKYMPSVNTKLDDLTAFSGLERFLNMPIADGLFFHTAWYKDTQWIGALAHKGTDYFIKIFKQTEECLFETRQHIFVRDHFNGPFVTVPVSMASHVHIFSPLIPRARGVCADDHIIQKLILVQDMFTQTRVIQKQAYDMIPMDMHSIVHGLNCRGVVRAADNFVKSYDKPVNVIPMHGDMTPWNMFVGYDEKIILVDYERAGWHAEYYDLFHYVLQPEALRTAHKSVHDIMRSQNWYEPQVHKINLVLYLLDQIYFDLDTSLRKRYRHVFIDRLIEHKTRWLAELVGA